MRHLKHVFGLIFFVLLLSANAAEENFVSETEAEKLLPAGPTPQLTLIQNIKYPSKEKVSLSLGYTNLSYDKFITQHGLNVRGEYFGTETLGFGLMAAIFRNRPTTDAHNAQIYTYAPDSLLGANVILQLSYGKFQIGERIQHFRLQVRGGPTVGNFQLYDGDKPLSGLAFRKIGLSLGSSFVLPFTSSLYTALSADYLAFKSPVDSYDDKYRHMWSLGTSLGWQF